MFRRNELPYVLPQVLQYFGLTEDAITDIDTVISKLQVHGILVNIIPHVLKCTINFNNNSNNELIMSVTCKNNTNAILYTILDSLVHILHLTGTF